MEDSVIVYKYIVCQDLAEKFGWELTCAPTNFTLDHEPTNFKASYKSLDEVEAALDMVEKYES